MMLSLVFLNWLGSNALEDISFRPPCVRYFRHRLRADYAGPPSAVSIAAYKPPISKHLLASTSDCKIQAGIDLNNHTTTSPSALYLLLYHQQVRVCFHPLYNAAMSSCENRHIPTASSEMHWALCIAPNSCSYTEGGGRANE
jgi:hypothetical protein